MVTVSAICVPMAMNTHVKYNPDQRQALWRQLFQGGQPLFGPTLLISACLAGLSAYYSTNGLSRKLLAGACASFVGVMVSTPIFMLKAGLRENLLTKTGGKDSCERSDMYLIVLSVLKTLIGMYREGRRSG